MKKLNLSEEMEVPFCDGSDKLEELEKEKEEMEKETINKFKEVQETVEEVNHPKDTEVPKEVELPVNESLNLNENINNSLLSDISDAIINVLSEYTLSEDDYNDIVDTIRAAADDAIDGIDYLLESVPQSNKNSLTEEFKLISGLDSYKPWSGAEATWNKIVDANMVDELDSLLEELYPEGLSDTELNDILWFESDWVLNSLGIATEDTEEDN